MNGDLSRGIVTSAVRMRNGFYLFTTVIPAK
jgi:hypothetical protein